MPRKNLLSSLSASASIGLLFFTINSYALCSVPNPQHPGCDQGTSGATNCASAKDAMSTSSAAADKGADAPSAAKDAEEERPKKKAGSNKDYQQKSAEKKKAPEKKSGSDATGAKPN